MHVPKNEWEKENIFAYQTSDDQSNFGCFFVGMRWKGRYGNDQRYISNR